MTIDQRTLTKIQTALRQGLRDKQLVDTALWGSVGELRPQVLKQVSREWLRNHGFSEQKVGQISQWLKEYHNIELPAHGTRPL
jgi:cell division inhibitor SulA